jgi:hypothetical protein
MTQARQRLIVPMQKVPAQAMHPTPKEFET